MQRFFRSSSLHLAQHAISSYLPSLIPYRFPVASISHVHSRSFFTKILIANRGEIAARILRTAQKLDIKTVAVYSDADKYACHVRNASESFYLGPSPANESYLLADKILDIAVQANVEAIHPGYGFLSENEKFAQACFDRNITFIGPPVKAIQAMGSKSASKEIMTAAGVHVIPGYHGSDQSPLRLKHEAEKIGYPLLIKAVCGGGGKGMRLVRSETDFDQALDSCKRESNAFFGDERVLLEKYFVKARHIEFQIFADQNGGIVHLFERDCSIQRRHQKVIEEAPALALSCALRELMGKTAVNAAKAVGYVGAGTVEFLLDEDDKFYFMEMNTRLQVEHPVTEMITKQDLVEWQFRVAAGYELPLRQENLRIHGHAIEARIYAENPCKGFLPGAGKLHHIRLPELSSKVRVDTGFTEGDAISTYYDAMIAKLIVHGDTREDAIRLLLQALRQYQIVGPWVNMEFLMRIALLPEFRDGKIDTSFLAQHTDTLLRDADTLAEIYALGSVLSLLLEEKEQTSRSKSPWHCSSLRCFRSMDTLRQYVIIHSPGKDVRACVECLSSESFRVMLDGQEEFAVNGNMQSDGSFNMRANSHTLTGTALSFKNALLIFCKETPADYVHSLQISAPPLAIAQKEETGSQDKVISVTSPIPARIVKVLVSEDENVVEEQPILIVQAMKMEHIVRATRAGRIRNIRCKEGTNTDDSQELMQLH